jgi:hypothetical protein
VSIRVRVGSDRSDDVRGVGLSAAAAIWAQPGACCGGGALARERGDGLDGHQQAVWQPHFSWC